MQRAARRPLGGGVPAGRPSLAAARRVVAASSFPFVVRCGCTRACAQGAALPPTSPGPQRLGIAQALSWPKGEGAGSGVYLPPPPPPLRRMRSARPARGKLLSGAGAGAVRPLRRSALGACALPPPAPSPPPHCVPSGGACAVPCPALPVSRYVPGITSEPLPEGHRPERPAPAPRGCRLSEQRQRHHQGLPLPGAASLLEGVSEDATALAAGRAGAVTRRGAGVAPFVLPLSIVPGGPSPPGPGAVRRGLRPAEGGGSAVGAQPAPPPPSPLRAPAFLSPCRRGGGLRRPAGIGADRTRVPLPDAAARVSLPRSAPPPAHPPARPGRGQRGLRGQRGCAACLPLPPADFRDSSGRCQGFNFYL